MECPIWKINSVSHLSQASLTLVFTDAEHLHPERQMVWPYIAVKVSWGVGLTLRRLGSVVVMKDIDIYITNKCIEHIHVVVEKCIEW